MNQITTHELQEKLTRNESITVLDIRRLDERNEWFIPGSLHAAIYDALKAGDTSAMAEIKLPMNDLVVTVCGAGQTSLIAAQQLQARGFNVASLMGGMKAWSLAWNTAEVSLPGAVQILQIRRTGKGCLSYLIGCEGSAAVIDASLEPDVYLALADQYGWRITHVLDTHIHADHLSRGRKLADQCGATLYLPAQKRVNFPFTAVQDQDVLAIGTAQLVVYHTPGHTAESSCYLLNGQALFTGDTLFLAGIGRPDLEASPAEAKVRAQWLYHSLQRLLTLPTGTLVLPGHAHEPIPFDGQTITASIAQVCRQVPFLSLPADTFIVQLLSRIPLTPPNHHQIVMLNEGGILPDNPVELEAGANRCAVR